MGIILQSDYVNPHYSYQNLVQTTFILDDKCIISSFNAQVPKTLYYKSKELFKADFGKFIAPQSFSIWNEKRIIAENTNVLKKQVDGILIPTVCFTTTTNLAS